MEQQSDEPNPNWKIAKANKILSKVLRSAATYKYKIMWKYSAKAYGGGFVKDTALMARVFKNPDAMYGFAARKKLKENLIWVGFYHWSDTRMEYVKYEGPQTN